MVALEPDDWLDSDKRKVSWQARFHGLSPMVRTPMLGFGMGFVFGSTIGILHGLGDLFEEEIRLGKRFKMVAKTGCTWGSFCGVLVAGGFMIASSRRSS